VATLCFLTSRRSNHFVNELLSAVAKAVAQEGADVAVAHERFPPFDDATVYVVVPHEFFALAQDAGGPTPWHLDKTIGFCVEQPGTPWFEETCRYSRSLGAVVDIRASVVPELRARGLAAEHFQLGYSSEWDHWNRDESVARPIDVLYLGSAEGRRDRLLAGYAGTLWPRQARLLIPPEAPKTGPLANYLVGEAKYRQLREAKILLNMHRTGADRLEWVRVLESICNGCVVLTEHSLDLAPLAAGEHLVSARAENLALLADHLLDDETRLAEMRVAAYDFVRSELSMAPAAQRLIAIAEEVVRRRRLFRSRGSTVLPVALPPGTPNAIVEAVRAELKPVRSALKRLAIETDHTRRQLEALNSPRAASGRNEAGLRVVAETPAYRAAQPRVTVGVSLHNYERKVVDALNSVAASDYGDYEVVVVDDCSSDGSLAAVETLLLERPWIPAVLLEHTLNRGLGRTRNAISAHARGDFVFVLDADNAIYPSALGRLVDALERDPAAMFAFGILACERAGVPDGLISAQPWDPARLETDNYIDAMALVRRERLIDLGGFSEDHRLVGFEDYDLWCRVAEQGEYGVQVPEILGRYRASADSMLSLTLIDTTVARSLIRAHAPTVMGPRGPSPESLPPADVLLAKPAASRRT